MTIHKLKIQSEYLDNLVNQSKKSEIRLNDRDYQTGDILEFTDYREDPPIIHRFKITHIHSGLGLKEGYVVLSISTLNE